MSEERHDVAGSVAGAGVKVVDRRRFRPDGEPVAEEPAPAAAASPGAAAETAPPDAPPPEALPDDRDDRLAAQAARIDELTRAYARPSPAPSPSRCSRPPTTSSEPSPRSARPRGRTGRSPC